MAAEKVGEDTTFDRIIELVEEAQESKTKTEKYLDRFAAIYTPAVMVLAFIVYVLTRNLNMAITFLVIACPGALVIGAPVSSVAGIGNGAKRNGGKHHSISRPFPMDSIIFRLSGNEDVSLVH